MNCKIVAGLLVLLSWLQCSTGECQPLPTSVELVERWVDWTASLERIPAVHLRIRSFDAERLASEGKGETLMDIYSDQAHLSNHQVIQLVDGESEVRAHHQNDYPMLVTLVNGASLTVIGRHDESEKWSIIHTSGDPVRQSFFGHVGVLETEFREPANIASLARNGIVTVDSDQEISVEIKLPKRLEYVLPGYVSHQVVSLKLTFDRLAGMTPIKIERQLKATGYAALMSLDIKRLVEFEADYVPAEVEESWSVLKSGEGEPAKLVKRTVVDKIELTSSDEVARRSDLRYWQLSNPDQGRFPVRYFFIAICLLVAIGVWWRHSRST